ncbi:LAFA_0B05248g1_1 [Lachancea sp. 'fantastica']|nr:LAFA_0B05248g1_1 [Lachancea sp. 'fantastica']
MLRGTKLLLRLDLRLYATRPSKRVHNNRDTSSFRYKNGSKKKNRNLLLDALEHQLNTGKLPAHGTQLNKTVSILLEEVLPNTTVSLQQLRKLFQLILQGKVSTSHIDRACSALLVEQDGMVNVTEPQAKARTFKTAEKARSDLLELHPSTSKELHKTLDILSPEMTASGGTVEPNQKADWVASASNSKDINLSSLQSFLQTTEKTKREQRQFASEQTRKYQWNQNSGSTTGLSPGMLIFDNSTSRRRSFFSKIFYWKGLGIAQPDSKGNQAPVAMSTELLLYDLDKGTKLLTSWKAQLTNLHIEYKDLFTVINGSSRSPEHLLKIITDLEREKWQLIGDSAVDGARKLVFKREHEKTAGKRGFLLALNIGLTILFVGFASYGLQLREQRLQKTASSNSQNHHAKET